MPPIHLVLDRAPTLARFFSLLHIGAALMLLWSWLVGGLPLVLIYGQLIGLLLSWQYCLNLHAYRQEPWAMRSLTYEPVQDRWLVKFNNQEQAFFNLSGDSTLTFGLALLKFKQEGQFLCKSTLICRETVGKDSFRQLRKWWRSYGQTSRSL